MPVAFALAFGAFAAFAPFSQILLVTISQNMAASLNSFTLLAIPFFILAAAVMNAGGITPRLVDLAMQLVGHLRGGLGQANVVTNTMLAGISGSSTADASTIAKLLVPEMAQARLQPAVQRRADRGCGDHRQPDPARASA